MKRYRVAIELQDLDGAPDGYTVVGVMEVSFASKESALAAVREAWDRVLIARAGADLSEMPAVPR